MRAGHTLSAGNTLDLQARDLQARIDYDGGSPSGGCDWSQMKVMSRFRRYGLAKISFTAALPSLLCLCFFFGGVPRMRAADERTTHLPTLQASVDPRPITLRIVDGTDVRF